MDLEEWKKKELGKSRECILRVLETLGRGHKIDWFEDVLCEYKDLKEESYASLHPGGSPEICEHFPHTNLGLLLGSGVYNKILVPLRAVPDKVTFEFRYGLSENRGAHLNFDQFLSLIEDGKLRICLPSAPTSYTSEFYQEIFKACGDLPVCTYYRNLRIFQDLRLISIASSKDIKPSEHWREKVLKSFPEYDLSKCEEEAKHVFSDYLKTFAQREDYASEEEATNVIASRLVELRLLGFERLVEMAMKCASLDKELGDMMLDRFKRYLSSPISLDLFAFQNYGYKSIQEMSFLNLLPKKLETIWNDILSSSPVSSSVASSHIGLDTIVLNGSDLLRIIQDFHDDDNAKAVRKNIVNVNKSLGKLDVQSAERSFDKIDEIISENINSEIRSYHKRGRVVSHLLRLGKTFTSIMAEGSAVLSGFMAATGKFGLAVGSLAGFGISSWIRERLSEIKPEDVVRWWSKSWPFDDPGIGFLIWQKSHEKSSSHN